MDAALPMNLKIMKLRYDGANDSQTSTGQMFHMMCAFVSQNSNEPHTQ